MIAWPQVVSWMLTTCPTLPGWGSVEIYDGKPVTGDDPADYLIVGHVPDDNSGNFTQEMSGVDYARTELGMVRSVLTCQSGDDDPAGLRTHAFTLLGALDTAVRADPTLGGALNGMATLAVDDIAPATGQGRAVDLIAVLHYQTLTFP